MSQGAGRGPQRAAPVKRRFHPPYGLFARNEGSGEWHRLPAGLGARLSARLGAAWTPQCVAVRHADQTRRIRGTRARSHFPNGASTFPPPMLTRIGDLLIRSRGAQRPPRPREGPLDARRIPRRRAAAVFPFRMALEGCGVAASPRAAPPGNMRGAARQPADHPALPSRPSARRPQIRPSQAQPGPAKDS